MVNNLKLAISEHKAYFLKVKIVFEKMQATNLCKNFINIVKNVIIRGIFHVVSCFPLHSMLYHGNFDCFSNSAANI